jgi:preprotein translocase subunit YajC
MNSNFVLFAQAAGSPAPAPSGIFGGPLPMIILMAVMMFVLMRSQSKRQRELEAVQKALKVGDEVITAGGMHGSILSLRDKTVILRVGDNVKIEFDRQAIGSVKKKTDVIDA